MVKPFYLMIDSRSVAETFTTILDSESEMAVELLYCLGCEICYITGSVFCSSMVSALVSTVFGAFLSIFSRLSMNYFSLL